MARMKHYPKNWTEADKILAGRDSIKIGHNTYLECISDNRAEYAVRYHNTYIVRFFRDGGITLHNGGWYTSTTKERMNEFITGRVYQKNHDWFYVGHDQTGALDWTHPIPFGNGMDVSKL